LTAFAWTACPPRRIRRLGPGHERATRHAPKESAAVSHGHSPAPSSLNVYAAHGRCRLPTFQAGHEGSIPFAHSIANPQVKWSIAHRRDRAGRVQGVVGLHTGHKSRGSRAPGLVRRAGLGDHLIAVSGDVLRPEARPDRRAVIPRPPKLKDGACDLLQDGHLHKKSSERYTAPPVYRVDRSSIVSPKTR
jgi:hypothetical protein